MAFKELIIKGLVLDDERLKQGKRFGKDYFDEFLERMLKGTAKNNECIKVRLNSLN